MNPWEDPDLLAYRRLLQNDPCSYCGGPGGTVDHIVPKAHGGPKWDTQNWTGACARCNTRKDKGYPGGHRTILSMVLGCRQTSRVAKRDALLATLMPGDVIYTPWDESAVVYEILDGNVFAWLPEQGRMWRCANPFALRNERGGRLSETVTEQRIAV